MLYVHTCFLFLFCFPRKWVYYTLSSWPALLCCRTRDGGWTISSPSFVFRTGGCLVSFATMEKSKSHHNTAYLIRGRRKSCNREGHIFFIPILTAKVPHLYTNWRVTTCKSSKCLMTNASLIKIPWVKWISVELEIFWEDLSDIYLKDILQFFILLLISALIQPCIWHSSKGLTTVMQSLIVSS